MSGPTDDPSWALDDAGSRWGELARCNDRSLQRSIQQQTNLLRSRHVDARTIRDLVDAAARRRHSVVERLAELAPADAEPPAVPSRMLVRVRSHLASRVHDLAALTGWTDDENVAAVASEIVAAAGPTCTLEEMLNAYPAAHQALLRRALVEERQAAPAAAQEAFAAWCAANADAPPEGRLRALRSLAPTDCPTT